MSRSDNHSPILDYERDTGHAGLLVTRHAEGLTIVLAPIHWRRLWKLASVVVVLVIALALFSTLPLAAGEAEVMPIWMSFIGLIAMAPLYMIGYGIHLRCRRIRIDLDDTHLRATMSSPFARWTRSWRRSRVEQLLTQWEMDEMNALNRLEERAGKEQWAFHQLFVCTEDGAQQVLLDSPDWEEVEYIEKILRVALGLVPPKPPRPKPDIIRRRAGSSLSR